MKKMVHTKKLSLKAYSATETKTRFASAQNCYHHQENHEFLAGLFSSLLPPSSVTAFYWKTPTKT